jgi:hypothetical protein
MAPLVTVFMFTAFTYNPSYDAANPVIEKYCYEEDRAVFSSWCEKQGIPMQNLFLHVWW